MTFFKTLFGFYFPSHCCYSSWILWMHNPTPHPLIVLTRSRKYYLSIQCHIYFFEISCLDKCLPALALCVSFFSLVAPASGFSVIFIGSAQRPHWTMQGHLGVHNNDIIITMLQSTMTEAAWDSDNPLLSPSIVCSCTNMSYVVWYGGRGDWEGWGEGTIFSLNSL